MRRAVRAKATRGTRGNVVILVGLLLVLLLGFAALVIDLGYFDIVVSEQQNAADAAALAGVQDLDGTLDGIANARASVKAYALRHIAATEPVDLLDSDIVFGHWYDESNSACAPHPCFEPLGSWPTEAQATEVNAIRVNVERSEAAGNPVATFLGRVFNNDSVDLTRAAVATGRARQCRSFPMIVPSCAASNDPDGDGQCDWCAVFQNNNEDTAGWTGFDEQANNAKLYSLIQEACFDSDGNVAVDPNTGFCTGTCHVPPPAIGDDVPVNNGNFLNASKTSPCLLIQQILSRENPPKAFKVIAPVMAEDASQGPMCEGAHYSGTHTIDSFTTLTIFGASCGNSKQGEIVLDPGSATPQCQAPPSGKYIVAASDCGAADGGGEGGEGDRIRLRM